MSTKIRIYNLTRSRRDCKVSFNNEQVGHTFQRCAILLGLQDCQVSKIVPLPMAIIIAVETFFLICGLLRNFLLWPLSSFCFFTNFFLVDFFLEDEARSTIKIVPLKLFKVPSVITSMFNNLALVHCILFIW